MAMQHWEATILTLLWQTGCWHSNVLGWQSSLAGNFGRLLACKWCALSLLSLEEMSKPAGCVLGPHILKLGDVSV